MPIAIIIAMFVALFTLGLTRTQSKGSPDQVVIIGGKQYNWANKKDNRNTLVLMAAETDNAVTIKGQRSSTPLEHIFQLSGLYQIIKAEPMVVNNNSNKSNIEQAICLSEKE
ncbi:hypothetical protein [Longitalea luteola]|uniref:hypothetical protein n=1 Tax=Longitalea luteola TaxID=2812563 RepID=UPI001A9737B0|nr:hypothetical protein [Longitalea luteola]